MNTKDNSLNLIYCLENQSWRIIQMLTRINHFQFKARWSHLEAVRNLLPHLIDPERLVRSFSTLSAEADTALRVLLNAGGQLEYAGFISRFGELRPYRPWRDKNVPAPWEPPLSPTEELFYQGWIFPLKVGSRSLRVFVLPMDYHPFLAENLKPATLPAAPVETAAPPLLKHLFVFLSFLQRSESVPLHERWLPSAALDELGRFFSLRSGTAPDSSPLPRSELQAPYLTFLHYLAESAGLIGLFSGRLKPTSAAWDWVTVDPFHQLQSLWSAWSAESPENRERRRRFRQPPAREPDPLGRTAQLHTFLADQTPGAIWTSAIWTTQAPELLRPLAPYRIWADLDSEARAEYSLVMQEKLSQVLSGPLSWLGVVAPLEASWILTPTGAALLGRPDGIALPVPPPETVRITADSLDETTDFCLKIVPAQIDEPSLAGFRRLELESLIAPQPKTPGFYRLKEEDLARALQQGRAPADLTAFLEALAGPLPPLLVETIYRQAEAVERIALRRRLVLETDDPTLLLELTAQRRIRETLGETLSARHVCVRADRVSDLLRRLKERGIIPRLDESLELPATSEPEDPRDQEAIVIAAALEFYARMADALGRPVPAPHTSARTWRDRLSPAQQEAADHWITALLSELHRAAPQEGDVHLPAPTGPLIVQLEQETRLDDCTHAVLLTPDAESHEIWAQQMRRPRPLRSGRLDRLRQPQLKGAVVIAGNNPSPGQILELN